MPSKAVSAARLSAADVSRAGGPLRQRRAVLDCALAMPGLPAAFYRLSAFRLAAQTVCPACGALVGQDVFGQRPIYRRTLREQGLPLVYDPSPAQRDLAPELAPSTLWRWLSWLGGMSNTLHAATDLLRQHEPNSPWHRQVWEPGSGKFRSLRRKETLQQAMKLLALSELLEKLSVARIFPNLAMVHSWS